MMKTFHIGIYAPSGNIRDNGSIDRAKNLLMRLGHHVQRDPSLQQKHERFAGSDSERLAALYRMLNDPSINLALPARGGYGWTRLLDEIDYHAFENDKTLWLGHSDFTAFQCALYAKTRRISFAAPMACFDFGAETPSDFTIRHCFDLLNANHYVIKCALCHPHITEFSAEGILWGGNLSMLTHLAGTPYIPHIENGILFIEDVAEAPYRIERMLYQLFYSGILQRQKAVLLGSFDRAQPGEHDYGYDLSSAVMQAEKVSNVPFFSGLPFGHICDKITLPFGATARVRISPQKQSCLEVFNYQP